MRNARDGFHAFIEFLWRFVEVHGYRFILFVLVLVAIKHYCALNFLIIVLVSLAVCLPPFTALISLLLVVYMSLIFISRRVYQLHFSHRDNVTRIFEDGDMPSNATHLSNCLKENVVEEFNTTTK